MARNFAEEYKKIIARARKKPSLAPIPMPKRTDGLDIDIFRQDLGFASPLNPNSLTDSTSQKLRSSLPGSFSEKPVASNLGFSDNTIKNIFALGSGNISGSNFLKNVLPLEDYKYNALENSDFIPDNLKSSLLSGLSLKDAIQEVGTDRALSASGLPENIQGYIKNGLPEDQKLRDIILPGMLASLPISDAYKNDLIQGKGDKEKAANDLLEFIDIPQNIKNLYGQDPKKMALDYINENAGLPFDISESRDDSYLFEKNIDIGPGTLEIDKTVGGNRPGTSMSYNVRDYKISPSVTAQLEANLDDQRKKNAELGVKYQRPGSNFSIDGRASFEEGRGPAFNINFERKF